MDTLPLWPLFLAATIVFGIAFAAMAIGVMVSRTLPARLLRRAGRDRPRGRAPVLRYVPQPEQGPGDEACRRLRGRDRDGESLRAGPLASVQPLP